MGGGLVRRKLEEEPARNHRRIPGHRSEELCGAGPIRRREGRRSVRGRRPESGESEPPERGRISGHEEIFDTERSPLLRVHHPEKHRAFRLIGGTRDFRAQPERGDAETVEEQFHAPLEPASSPAGSTSRCRQEPPGRLFQPPGRRASVRTGEQKRADDGIQGFRDGRRCDTRDRRVGGKKRGAIRAPAVAIRGRSHEAPFLRHERRARLLFGRAGLAAGQQECRDRGKGRGEESTLARHRCPFGMILRKRPPEGGGSYKSAGRFNNTPKPAEKQRAERPRTRRRFPCDIITVGELPLCRVKVTCATIGSVPGRSADRLSHPSVRWHGG